MKTLSVPISDTVYWLYGLKSDKLAFGKVRIAVSRHQFKKDLKNSVDLDEECRLSVTTLDEIENKKN